MNPLELTKILSDEYNVKILAATFKTAHSADYLSRRLDIPIAACYRRIHLLRSAGLLKVEKRVLNTRGKWVTLYRSNLNRVSLAYERGKMRIYVEKCDPEDPVDEGLWDINIVPERGMGDGEYN
ncbi:MAG TPA: ArsR family transcriptional regulator [Euryarchaeota archaeon]|nr:MAG: transcriptional regulator [Thermoplasmata archaeon]HDD60362.1 ArsR family transcriptional regulator [Euryarchaeota archaeon]